MPATLLSTIAIFALLRLLPGDPALVLAGENASPEQVEALRTQLGLDQPIVIQYLIWIWNVMRGDLGSSLLSGFPVIDLIWRRFPATFQLAVASMVLTILIALPLGLLSAVRQGGKVDTAVRAFNGIALAIPGFWLSILSILLFALVLGWLPPGGRVDPLVSPVDGLKALALPALTLAIRHAAGVARHLRSSMLEVLGEDYVRTARAKGLRNRATVVGHALPNALVPVVTVLGLQFGNLLGGSVITEVVFTWPGIGRLIVESIGARDYAVVQGALLLFVITFVLVNLATDIAYGLLDPRIRMSQQVKVS